MKVTTTAKLVALGILVLGSQGCSFALHYHKHQHEHHGPTEESSKDSASTSVADGIDAVMDSVFGGRPAKPGVP